MKFKNLLVALISVQVLSALPLTDTLAGGKEWGGAPPPPLAVVILQHPVSGNYDPKIRALVREKAAADLAAGTLTAFLDRNDQNRLRWCLEYSISGKWETANAELRALLKDFRGVEIRVDRSCVK